ncbi:hypothetical protein AVEN_64409-1 [Araneus ventricosus]|uniref:Uncharacterized protein n=1 Tax=Araneus ventricosus TaxID=182803 RepID=A0A4Y2H9Y3_ARAVE|nr:hypothetical protein AVEN_64409-1 [Araneus ventricosus]
MSCGLMNQDTAYSRTTGAPTVQASGSSIMIWGCFNGPRLPPATLYDNKMKSLRYLSVFNDQAIPSMDFFFPSRISLIQDDNAKIQRALIILNCFRKHADSFSRMN